MLSFLIKAERKATYAKREREARLTGLRSADCLSEGWGLDTAIAQSCYSSTKGGALLATINLRHPSSINHITSYHTLTGFLRRYYLLGT